LSWLVATIEGANVAPLDDINLLGGMISSGMSPITVFFSARDPSLSTSARSISARPADVAGS